MMMMIMIHRLGIFQPLTQLGQLTHSSFKLIFMLFTKDLEKKEALYSLLDDFVLLQSEAASKIILYSHRLNKLREIEHERQFNETEKIEILKLFESFYSELSHAQSLNTTYSFYISDLKNRISKEKDD